MSQSSDAPKGMMQRILDVVERVGNLVPHPVLIFMTLIAIVIILSHILYLAGVGVGVTYEAIVPEAAADAETIDGIDQVYDTGMHVDYEVMDEKNYHIAEQSISVRSLLTAEGIRFIYVSLIPNFMSFTAVGLMIAAMVGAGVAEESGLVNAIIRKLVIVSPRWALIYILSFVGILSSIAADAGYLVLIPLAGIAFMSVGRHPLAGLALGFAAVAGAFTVNMLIKPLDAVLVEFTNDAIQLVDPDVSIGLASNLWFSIASVVVLTFVLAIITEKIIEPRLGKYDPKLAGDDQPDVQQGALTADESRGLKFASIALLITLGVFGYLTLPANAILRSPETGELIGNSPFMNGLIALIMILFLVTGSAYGFGARTITSLTGNIKAMEKAMSGLGSLILLFLVLSQFVAYFNYTNMGTILALKLAEILKAANFPALLLLIGFIVVVALIDLLITGAIAKWALFAPIFVPLLMTLSVAPEAVLAAYRVADSPMNTITPLNAYFALVVGFAQKYDKSAGVGTVVSLMLPYVVILFILWTALFAAWQWMGLPWGL
ncbi:AbgT family transporter [Bythopirellula polymerisocia]|uniref:p-aminobenzoyl-glutamate transport protein n=1 Tax=Bythopirellula polymerisocia TaxID=2528003 RepID=A0A5C6CZ83_9BACT|nr:AbgT family transporter [Bythopirellula polymerisocia]TWU29738.1 p-aminobenzoyl-glutamate transport protein [Bythopirellula polymerisocia]